MEDYIEMKRYSEVERDLKGIEDRLGGLKYLDIEVHLPYSVLFKDSCGEGGDDGVEFEGSITPLSAEINSRNPGIWYERPGLVYTIKENFPKTTPNLNLAELRNL